MAGREADELTRRQDPLPRRLAKHRSARDHVEPLLDPVVVVVWPDWQSRLGLIDGRPDALSAEPDTDRGCEVTEAGFVKTRVQLDVEDVHLLGAHA
jgi:hypothetical protein